MFLERKDMEDIVTIYGMQNKMLEIYKKHKWVRRGGIAKENKLHDNGGVCVDNLIKINTEDSDHTVRNGKNIACSLLNAQSLKKKD